jgi:hypothetical protein
MIEVILFWILSKAQAPWYLIMLLWIHVIYNYVPLFIGFLALVVKKLEEVKKQ